MIVVGDEALIDLGFASAVAALQCTRSGANPPTLAGALSFIGAAENA
jgi:sugar/nucleoside kinase (ribokinase family)